MSQILLLEPDELLAGQYASYLGSLGHRVARCKDAQEAINLADRKRPDLIILELLLASHSGIEFLYEFRSYGEWRTVPVVLLIRIPRGSVPASDKVLRSLGVAAYLYKPETSLKRLGQRIDAVLSQKATTSS